MENKIAISSLASSLASATGKTKKVCEDFLREYFRLVSEVLESGDTLKIKGFGTFKIVEVESRESVNIATGEKQEIAAYRKVSFTPAKELAAAINAPFIDFESVEMDDEIPEEIFNDEESADDEISNENNVDNQRLEVGSEEEGADDEITYEAYKDVERGETGPEETVPAEVPEESPVVLPEYDYDEEEPVKSRFGIGFLVGALSTFAVCAVIFTIGCFLDWWPVNFGNPKEQIVEIQEPNEARENQEELPQAEVEPVYDTVSTTRYLTTIAREHYGDFNFWPYIYLENESILGHPDRITPGTKVVVPELSKYGVEVSNPEDVKKAKAKAAEIYARFK